MKNKSGPASATIKRLLLSDFLSRIKIPISLDLQEVLEEKYYSQTMSGAHKAGITIGKIYGHDRSLLSYLN